MDNINNSIAQVSDAVNEYIPVWKLRSLAESATNYVMNYTEPEAKVREATNEDQWGPTGPLLSELVRYTNMYTTFGEVMGMLWQRMTQDNQGAWRRVYKSLLVLDHLIKNGSDRCINSAKDHLYDIRSLQHYQCIDHKGKDQGQNIRHRAKEIVSLLSDDENIKRARYQARENAKKFGGGSGSVSNFGSSSNYGRSNNYSSNSSNYNNNSSSGYYDSYDPSPSSNSGNNKNSQSGGGLGGWDGVVDDDNQNKTNDSENQKKDEEPDFFGTSTVDTQSKNAEPEVDFFNSNNNDTSGFDADWNQAPSSSNNPPRNVSEEYESSQPTFQQPKAVKKSVPRKLVSLGAAANYSGGGSAPVGKVPTSNVDLLGGLGDVTSQSPATNNNNNNNNDWDPFSDSGNAKPVNSSSATAAKPAADPFGDWMTTSTNNPVAQNNTNNSNSNNLNDLFSNLSTSNPTTTTTSNTIPANLSSLLNPVSNNNNNFSNNVNKSTQNQPKSASTATASKIQASSTWAGIDNLDSLVNMSNVTQSKKQSMNSMMSTNTSNNKTSTPSTLTPSSTILTPSSGNILTPTGATTTNNNNSAAAQPKKVESANDQFMGFF